MLHTHTNQTSSGEHQEPSYSDLLAKDDCTSCADLRNGKEGKSDDADMEEESKLTSSTSVHSGEDQLVIFDEEVRENSESDNGDITLEINDCMERSVDASKACLFKIQDVWA